jgi:hypothetical protein
MKKIINGTFPEVVKPDSETEHKVREKFAGLFTRG